MCPCYSNLDYGWLPQFRLCTCNHLLPTFQDNVRISLWMTISTWWNFFELLLLFWSYLQFSLLSRERRTYNKFSYVICIWLKETISSLYEYGTVKGQNIFVCKGWRSEYASNRCKTLKLSVSNIIARSF